MSNLYVVGQTGHSFVKIGMTTRSVDKRIGDWDTGSPYDWVIHLDLQVSPGTKLPVLEASVHARLHEYRVRNEWFSAGPKTVMDAITFALLDIDCDDTKLWRASYEYGLLWHGKKAA